MPRIMIVDDDVTIQLELEEYLKHMNHDVVGITDTGLAAVEMARDLKPDLILMDVVMPGEIDGISAAQRIKGETSAAVVFITGFDDPEYIERAKEVEPFGYVMKPFDEKEIGGVIEIVLSRRNLELKLKSAHDRLEQTNHDLQREIEERKKTEKALRESEERWQFALEGSRKGVWDWNALSNEVFFSKHWKDMLGYDEDEISNHLDEWETRLHPDDKKQCYADLNKHLNAQTPYYENEHRLLCKDGSYKWILDRGKVVSRAENNKPLRVIGTHTDITKRKQDEDALESSQSRLSQIINFLPDATMVIDLEGKVIAWNRAMEVMTCIKAEDILGKGNYEYAIPFYGTRRPVLIDLVGKWDKEIQEKYQYVKKEGESLVSETYDPLVKPGGFLRNKASLLYDRNGEPIGAIESIRDITERRVAEAALKESETLQRILLDTLPAGVLVVDPVTRLIERANDHVATLFGASVDHLIGQRCHSLLCPADEGTCPVCDLGQAVDNSDREMLRKDGTRLPILKTVKRVVLNGHEKLLECFVDVSGRKRAEAEREQLRDQLIQAQKMEAIATLAGGIAHDYNNLLSIVMGNLSIAREEIDPHSVVADFLSEAEKASLKARDLTHEFLTLSHGGHPHKEKGSIVSLLKEIPEQVQANNGIECILSIQDGLWPVEYDTKQMQYAINNVFTNAVEAMPQGGTITLQAENQVIDNNSKHCGVPLKEGKYVVVSVIDEGRGISEKHLNQIFDPYFSTRERGVQKGMGLGLTIAYAAVQKHGGHILVDSTTGVGTTVTIYLPAMGGEVQSAPRDDAEAQPTISHQQSSIRRILVMDDEEMLRNLAQKMLELLVYEVETVKDGDEAIEQYKRQMDSGKSFEAVILDLTIKGGMGGEQTIRELLKIDPDVKAVVSSGYFDDPVMANYKEHGFRGALAKPYRKKDLELVLEKVLG